jgi:HD-GYP domain
MIGQEIASLSSLALSLSAALDMVSPSYANHHQRTAFVAYNLGLELGLPLGRRKDLLLAGAFHDIGALMPADRVQASPGSLSPGSLDRSAMRAEIGYRLLRGFEPLAEAAEIIRYCRLPWAEWKEARASGVRPLPESNVLCLADKVAWSIPEQGRALSHAAAIVDEVGRGAGSLFDPDCVTAFAGLAKKEAFWLDAASSSPMDSIKPVIELDPIELDTDTLIDFGRLLSRIIDFRSPFTAAHSSGVSATAGALAGLAGFSGEECFRMRLAGYLHDLGKLAVPAEIIEKPGALSAEETFAMRAHSYYGFRTLQKAPALETVNLWASLHHERLDGSGYPFHLGRVDLPLGSRIMAVADVLTALSEERPYRSGMRADKALGIVASMAREGALDPDIVELASSSHAEIEGARREAMGVTLAQYDDFFSSVPDEAQVPAAS